MIGVHLLLVAAWAPGLLARAGWVYRSPQLGIAAWYAALIAVLSAVAVAVVSMVAPWRRSDAPVCVAWRWCIHAARGDLGVGGQVAAAAILLVGAGLAARIVVCGVRLTRASAARRRAHLQLLGLAGRQSRDLGATVVDSPEPAAYVVAGHDRRVVVTSGALDVLTAAEVAAVLAHERAHAAGRHDLLLDGVRLLQAAFPGVALFDAARAQLGRLLEMRADEVAVASHSPISLARALVAMASATSAAPASAPPVPAGALAATGGEAAERLRRLLEPPTRLTGLQRALIAAGIAAVAAMPLSLFMAAQVYPALGICPTLPS